MVMLDGIWVCKMCLGPIQSELRYSDAQNDYYFPVCVTCGKEVGVEDVIFSRTKVE